MIEANAPVKDKALSFLRLIRRHERGKLKIYLGYGAGVGKTYQMLLEGHQLKAEGVDVAIGLVETHGRADTSKLIDGLEVIPRSRHMYRGIVLEEMNVDAVLARKPQVALVDELAHTNVPGSRNPKRYQDVQEILQAGIHVITTLNVQHLESLYDTVESTLRVKVRERIPDSAVAEADQIVNVDLAPEDLRKRLIEGKIYPTDRIDVALNNFFADTNLEMLRELTLRELASQIDFRRREIEHATDSKAPDQVMVCLSSRGPNSEMLLRYGSRLAGRLNRNWYAVYVQTPHEEPTVIDTQTQTMLSSTLTLAKELGAIVFTYKGEDIVSTILSFAREYRVGHIVLGKPTTLPFWKRLLGQRSVAERLLLESKGLTIVVLDTWREEAGLPAAPVEETAREPDVAVPVPEPAVSRLGDLLSPDRVLIWQEPLSKEQALRELTSVAAGHNRLLVSHTLYERVLKRENEVSTFLGDGMALPHARIEGLTIPVLALGVARQGVEGVQSSHTAHLILLILSPADNPNVQVELLAQASQIARNHPLMRTIFAARDADDVLEAIRASAGERHE
ncbi:MAG: PTS sugar transporter subunit IIA [Thermodesulfobacteriota bacterium]